MSDKNDKTPPIMGRGVTLSDRIQDEAKQYADRYKIKGMTWRQWNDHEKNRRPYEKHRDKYGSRDRDIPLSLAGIEHATKAPK